MLRLIFLLLFLVIRPLECLAAKQTLQSGELLVVFDEPARAVAGDVVSAYPLIKAEIEETFGWKADFGPMVAVVLLSEEEFLRGMPRSSPVAAYAIVRDNAVVINLLRAEKAPSRFGSVLKHELAHLYLGRHIKEANMPKWLNEGVVQWTSGGVSELLLTGGAAEIEKATLRGSLIPLRDLVHRFPRDERRLRLAYEESRSMVSYIVREYGREGLLSVLNHMKEGYGVREAVLKGLALDMEELELKWRAHLKRKHTLLAYIGNNIYTLLFAFAALITVYGFVRVIIRIKTYRDEDDEGHGPFKGT